jgi:3-hydroxyacyl-CoA dehydrogenase
MAAAINEALALNLDVEEADAVIGKPFGTPDRGIFGLADLVGIDLLPPVWRSLQSALPADDFMQLYPTEHPLIVRLIAEGRTGRKTGAGFMRRNPNGNYDVLDLATGEYRPQRRVVSAALDAARGDLRTLMSHASPAGQYVGRVMGRTLAYAASLVPEIADSPDLVDQAMRDGYGWKEGPFELIDRIGPQWLSRHLFLTGVPVPQFLNEATSDDRFYVLKAGERWCRIPGQDKRLIVQHAGRVSLNS